jgi:4-hydroxy-4-methyl-2-oxoglutarate aldolase
MRRAVPQTSPGTTLDAQVIARAAKLSAASLHEAAGRSGALPAALKAIHPAMRTCGSALPVQCPAGDNLWIHRALAVAEPGDVLVVDTGGGTEFGYWGEIMATAALARNVAGLVITGGVRDSLRLIELGLPTFAATITIRGTAKDPKGDGAVGRPIRLGEAWVRKGDLVLGDADGVVVLSPATAVAAVPVAEKRDADETEILQRVRAGVSTLDLYELGAEGKTE